MKAKLLLCFIICTVLTILQSGVNAETLRIGLVRRFKNVQEVSITSTGSFSIVDANGNTLLAPGAGETFALRLKGCKIELTGPDESKQIVESGVIFKSTSPNCIAIIPKSGQQVGKYRGDISAIASDNGIFLVNIVDLEDYLTGVLPAEMPADFKSEALKAQAVAARTYALANRGKHIGSGFDLCDDTHCQLYTGVAGEKPQTTKAVKDTTALVAVYNGKLISAQYCGDCGGITQDGGQPYLTSVQDQDANGSDYCEHNGHEWSQSWKMEEFVKLLKKAYPALEGVTGISVTDTDASGRASNISIEADSGTINVSAAKIRTLLGSTFIKSTAFTVSVDGDTVTFEGKGAGHGVGLCQRGANGLASSPSNFTFEQILKHYYTGIEIHPLSTVTAHNGP
jgi:stage II sporulation protein D